MPVTLNYKPWPQSAAKPSRNCGKLGSSGGGGEKKEVWAMKVKSRR
jgi:hypothetical protein